MKQAPGDPRLWYGLAWLGMIGTLCVWGMLANRLTPLQMAATVGFGGVVVPMAWLWQLNAQRTRTAQPPTRLHLVWHVALCLIWMFVIALGWLYASQRGD